MERRGPKLMEMDRTPLLYELDSKRKQLNFAIEESEHQLASAKKRLDQLKTDLWLFIALLAIPPLLYGFITFIMPAFLIQESLKLIYVLLGLCQSLLKTGYILAAPVLAYKLIETFLLVRNNREREDVFYSLPPIAGSMRGNQPERTENYRTEYEKLVLVLSRYYSYRDKMDELNKELDADDCSMTLSGLKLKLKNDFPLYEQIRPSNNSGKAMNDEKKIGIIVALFTSVVILVVMAVNSWKILCSLHWI